MRGDSISLSNIYFKNIVFIRTYFSTLFNVGITFLYGLINSTVENLHLSPLCICRCSAMLVELLMTIVEYIYEEELLEITSI